MTTSGERPRVIRVDVEFEDGTCAMATGEAADAVFRPYPAAPSGILPIHPPLAVPGLRVVRWGNPAVLYGGKPAAIEEGGPGQ